MLLLLAAFLGIIQGLVACELYISYIRKIIFIYNISWFNFKRFHVCVHMIGEGRPVFVSLSTHCAVLGMEYIYVHMIGNGRPFVVGLSTHCTYLGMEYI